MKSNNLYVFKGQVIFASSLQEALLIAKTAKTVDKLKLEKSISK